MEINEDILELGRKHNIRRFSYLKIFEAPENPDELESNFLQFKQQHPDLFGLGSRQSQGQGQGRELVLKHYSDQEAQEKAKGDS